MFTVGVTGGIGSGKSLVCDIFRSLFVPVYNADFEARRIMEENSGVQEGLTGYFGVEAYRDGKLNRPWIADRIFSDKEDREFVNSIVHPAVQEDFIRWTSQHLDKPYVIEEAALLFESHAYKKLDKLILVIAPEKLRIERIVKRDGLEQNEILARMESQINPDKAAKMADHAILNDEKSFVLPQVMEIHQKIMNGT
jgi:dephospho-CoA kinase